MRILTREIEEIRSDFNAKVKQWNAIPKEERRNNPGLRSSIERLKGQYEELTAKRKQIQDIPVVDQSEGNAYDFTRCVRPDGSAYGTGGKCRKGTEQPLFESDGGIQTGASGGVTGGRFFGRPSPIKVSPEPKKEKPTSSLRYADLRQSIVKEPSKPGFYGNKKKVDKLLDDARALLDRETELQKRNSKDDAFSDLHEPLKTALYVVRLRSDPKRAAIAAQLLKEAEQSGALHELL